MAKQKTVFVAGQWAFVPHPCGTAGLWSRSHRAIAFVSCPICKAKIGELCIGENGRMAETHWHRREAYKAQLQEMVTVVEDTK
jgi:hypothetical protein